MEKIKLLEFPSGDAIQLQIGDIHISGVLLDGKTCLTITALNGVDFLSIQPSTGNSINVMATKDIRIINPSHIEKTT
jgi:hypothetical protein